MVDWWEKSSSFIEGESVGLFVMGFGLPAGLANVTEFLKPESVFMRQSSSASKANARERPVR